MRYGNKPGMDESAGAVARGNKNSQPPGKTGEPGMSSSPRPKAKPSMMAPKSSKRPMADPKKKQATYPGRKQPNVKL
jgi:hypothetical protein